jgi:hypothetical protein
MFKTYREEFYTDLSSNSVKTHYRLLNVSVSTGRADDSWVTKLLQPEPSSPLSLLQRLSSLNLNSTTRSASISSCLSSTTIPLQMPAPRRSQGILKCKRTRTSDPNKQPRLVRRLERGRSRNKTFLPKTSNSPSSLSLTQCMRPRSRTLSGQTSSWDQWSISTTSSRAASQSPMTTGRSSNSEEWNSSSESLNQSSKLKLPEIGSSHGVATLKQRLMFSPTARMSLTPTDLEPYPYSQPPLPVPMLPSSTLTKVSAPASGNAETSSSWTKRNSKDLRLYWLNPIGAGGLSDVSCRIKKTDYWDDEPCFKWNAGECNKKASECRHRHICEICGKNHRKSEHKSKQGNT